MLLGTVGVSVLGAFVLLAFVEDTALAASADTAAHESVSVPRQSPHLSAPATDTKAAPNPKSTTSTSRHLRIAINTRDSSRYSRGSSVAHGMGAQPPSEAFGAKVGVLLEAALPGDTLVRVTNAHRFPPGTLISIGRGETFEVRRIKAVAADVLVLSEPLEHRHDSGERIQVAG